MIMLDLNLQQKHIKNCMYVASMIGVKLQLNQHVAKMANALCLVMMEKTVVKKKVLQWIVVRMANAPKKGIMVQIAVRNPINNN